MDLLLEFPRVLCNKTQSVSVQNIKVNHLFPVDIRDGGPITNIALLTIYQPALNTRDCTGQLGRLLMLLMSGLYIR